MPPRFNLRLFMNVRDKILQLIKSGEYAFKPAEKLFAALNIHPSERKAVKKILRELEKDGLILSCGDGWATSEQTGAVRGVVQANARGFAFVRPENGADMFIPRRSLCGAYDGDTVLCAPVRGTEDEGRILRVLERGVKEVIGRFYKLKGVGRVRPDNRRFPEVSVPLSLTGGAQTGDKVAAKITSYPQGGVPFAKVTEILGRDGDFLTDELALIRAHGLKEDFSAAAKAEADESARRPVTTDGRRDLRGLTAFTIDGEDTRDMDDAVSLEIRDGKYILGVHIADVAEYVKPFGKLDGEAYARGTSVYFPDRSLPMLPRSLSNGACSLNEGEDRATVSCFITYSKDGKRLSYELCESVIKSRRKLTYTEANAVLDGDEKLLKKYADLADVLKAMRGLCLKLESRRSADGAVDLAVNEVKITVADGKIEIPDCKRGISERIIEQFMIAANCAVAEFLKSKKLPCLFRIHEKPAEEKCESFAEFVRGLGMRADFDAQRVKPADFRNIISAAEGKPYFEVVNKVMLRSMQKARYDSVNCGHFGLALDDYCHFTSPIRRYPDLFCHRMVKAALRGSDDGISKYAREAGEAGKHLSLCERVADEAERDVDKLYICAYTEERLGEEYDAVISGVTNFGLFCETSKGIEGFVPIEDLPADGYEFYEEKFTLAGKRHTYRLGDPVKVRVAGCDRDNLRPIFGLL